MKLLDVASSTAQAVARPVVGAVKAAAARARKTWDAAEERRLDPFHWDGKRRAEINARSGGQLDEWIPERAREWFGRD